PAERQRAAALLRAPQGMDRAVRGWGARVAPPVGGGRGGGGGAGGRARARAGRGKPGERAGGGGAVRVQLPTRAACEGGQDVRAGDAAGGDHHLVVGAVA